VTAVPRPRAVHYAWIVAAVTFVTLLVAAVMVIGLGRPAGVPGGPRPTVEPLAVEV
jgi:hypothetical protein